MARNAVRSTSGLGLRAKFSILIVLIVAGVVALVSIPLSLFSLETQQRSLAEGLLSNVRVLIDSVANNASGLLLDPVANVLDLAALPGQGAALPAGRFITVTGIGADVSFNPDSAAESLSYVWATDDPALTEGQTGDFGQEFDPGDGFVPGLFQLTDSASPDLRSWQQELDEGARDRLGDIPRRIEELQQSIQQLTVAQFLAEDGGQLARARELQARLRQEQAEFTALSETLGGILRRVAGDVRSIPPFSVAGIDEGADLYLFYAPVVAAIPGAAPESARYFQGAVRLAVDTTGIQTQISQAQQIILQRILVAAGAALAAGIISGLLIATLVAVPVTRLVLAVEEIRTAADPTARRDPVTVRGQDELRTLADAVNLMAEDLRVGAIQADEIKAGKEVQQLFIPLRPEGHDFARTIAATRADGVEFFGYFEGARGVSGDYFDFAQINPRDWVFIKCDVSGKGIPAGIIATMVATMYKNEVKVWKTRYASRGMPGGVQSALVERMNDLIEARGFTGRFAAFNMGHLNLQTGSIRFCNAGDNLVNVFWAERGEVETVTLPRVPAAGVMNSEMLNGFPEQNLQVSAGDIVMLFTDGFDESRYFFRDEDWNPVSLDTSELPDQIVASQREKAQAIESGKLDSEEFASERQEELLRCATRREPFRLVRAAEAFGDELVVDFSQAPPTLETVCMGMVSVEKLWRLHRAPRSAEQVERDRPVRVDRNVDRFLSRYFNLYQTYFAHRVDEDDQYAYFSHLLEDDQTDDLTALMIRRIPR